MQPNPYPNDPNYSQPTETNPPMAPYQQGGQYVPPSYPDQAGEPVMPPLYEGQAGRPVTPPPNQYTAQPPPVSRGAAMSEGQTVKYAIGKIIDFVRWAIVALELLFLLRFVLKLIGADPQNLFAQFLYNLTGFFLYPFLNIVSNTQLGTKGPAVIEWSTLIGMAVYGIVYWILRLFLRTTVSSPEEPIQ
jgi:YGGT family protein